MSPISESRLIEPAAPTLSVALVSPGWPRDAFASGIVSYVETVGDGLRRLGHDVHVLTQKVVGDVEEERVHDLERLRESAGRVGRLGDRLLWRFAPERAAIRPLRVAIGQLAAREGLQVVEMEESFGWPGWLQGRLPVPLIVRLHGPWFLTGEAAGLAEDEAFLHRVRREGEGIQGADGVTAPSRFCLERVRQRYGLALSDAEVIPNPMPVAPEAERWRLADAEADRILFIGRIDRLKGADLVVEAYRRLRRERPGLRLQLVGPDVGLVDEAGRSWTLADYLADRVPEAWASGAIEWLGRQPGSALIALRQRASVTVVASRFENFPVAALEAMAQGCPVVASDVGGIPELIQDGANGLLFRVGDAGALAQALGRILDQPTLAARLGARAVHDCGARYDPDRLAVRTASYYQSRLIRAGRSRRGGP